MLVERETELSALDGRLDALDEGRGGVLVLEGGAGLGKSRLLDEAAARAARRDVSVLHARAFESEGEFPFAVALQLLEPSAAASREQPDALFAGAAELARALLQGTTAEHERPRTPFATIHGLYWVVANLAAARPRLLCVDDLHWCDEASLRFLSYLAARLQELPVTVVAALRPRGAGESAALAQWRSQTAQDSLRLHPLAPAGVNELVRSALAGAQPEFCRACAEVTGGNPFWLHELLISLQDDELPATDASAPRVRTLGNRVLGRTALLRLQRLDADAIELARAAAVLADGTPLRVAAALARLELDPAAVAADALAREQILAEGHVLEFMHPLIREAIHEEIPAAQRAVAHLSAARLLAADGAPPEQVATHLVNAAPAGDPWVVETLRRAARRARVQGAPEPAAHYLLRALQEPPAAEGRAEVLVELGCAQAAAGSEAAVDRLSEALGMQTAPAERAATALELARALARFARGREAAEVLGRALDELKHGDPATRDLSYVLLADYLASAVFVPGLRRQAIDRATPLLSVAPAGVTSGERRVLAALAMRSGQQGDPAADTIALARRAWADGALLADEGPGGNGWLMVDWALELAEAYGPAMEVTAATIDAARRSGSVYAFANASHFHGTAAYRSGRLLDAEADAEQAIAVQRAGWRRYLNGALVLRANVLIERGRLEDARRSLELAGQYDSGSMFDVPWRTHAAGRLELVSGNPAAALAAFRQAGGWMSERLEAQHTVLPWRTDAALAALALRDSEQARELVAPLLADGRRAGRRVSDGVALRIQGLIEGGEAGLACLQRAVDALADSEAALEHAYALADLGSALRRAGRRANARVQLRGALDLADRLGAHVLAARARAELLIAGARPRRERIAGVHALTASERRVAELAREGRTNSQIAQALFVTTKTVEFHLRHVYQKLDIPGRGELSRALAVP